LVENTFKPIQSLQPQEDLFMPEKFEAKRLQLATNVWNAMKSTDSRECRNCHSFESMDYTKQGRRGMDQHIKGVDQKKTCIDCHKGIAHSLPAMANVDPSVVIDPKFAHSADPVVPHK
jgi:cytochrome c-type protein NapC